MTRLLSHSTEPIDRVSRRADELYRENQLDIFRRTDRLFAGLMVIQWFAGVAAAYWISPHTWAGTDSATHIHVWAAIFLGGIISFFPVCLALARPGSTLTRHVIAIGQMLTAGLLIHLGGGRIETHFHIFGSLAFLACYRDWRVLMSATLVVAADHFLRGVYYPQSVFGVLTASPWRVFEHAGWIAFEDVFLLITIRQSVKEMKEMARNRAQLESTNQTVEAEVAARTHELQLQAKSLQESKQRAEELNAFGQIIDRSHNEIYIFNSRSLKFMHVNHGARDNIGYTMAELKDMTPLDIKPQHMRASFDEIVAPLRNGTKENIQFSTVHRRKDRSEYPVDVRLQMENFAGTKVFVAVILDTSERQKVDEELRESREDALTATRAKSEFLANMSHEIRTPMTAILGFTDILLDNVVDKDNVDAVHTIKANGNYLLELINDILDLSKIEAGKCQIEHLDCSPQRIVGEVASLMRVRAAAKNLPLEVRFEGGIPETIQSDPTRLRQVLINICGNAIKFTEHGSVTIVACLVDNPGDEPKMRFDVIDTGIGIARHKIDTLFSPFTQADNSTTRQFGGTGLGLTISKRLTKLLGGDISVQSTAGRGSTFSITVATGPLEKSRMIHGAGESESQTRKVSEAGQPQASLANTRILLAEDGLDNQRLIAFVLKKAGAEVVLADNGQIAFDLATEASRANRPFNVVLMDMQMPVLDGYSATRRLRDVGYTHPIIALTAHAMTGDREKCLDAGCDEYTTKPIDRKRLVAMLATYSCAVDVTL
ncbi:Sensory/regulatory protein RpfC [Symmachiella macrocystis]|uniref:histidine kinase n=1 Tax=Symmachiella macrocystis TaxID=2527985 RepID=A0A5C6B561_9PLAN|nr:ATP-binding protein [Symmachiella macrocystis]TWU06887.1 Sensory/regulatory protein RpfC [Symmachiella macrocystis]